MNCPLLATFPLYSLAWTSSQVRAESILIPEASVDIADMVERINSGLRRKKKHSIIIVAGIAAKVKHVELSARADFQERFIEAMGFE